MMLMPETGMNNQDNESPSAELPGTVISPGAATHEVNQNTQPETTTSQPKPITETPLAESPKFSAGEQKPQSTKASDTVSWTASEFIAHQKSAGWYGVLGIVAFIFATTIYLLTRDVITTGFVIFGAFVLGYYASRQPRELQYRLDGNGVSIGDKHYDYEAFRSFSIVTEGAFSSIIFMPLKRFAPLRAIYFAPVEEDRIINLLTPHLPFEDYTHDAVDRLMRHIRF